MRKIAIVTDSVACLQKDLAEKHNIYVAPVHIMWGKSSYRDGVDMSAHEFYTRLRTSKTLPTTSSAIQGEFVQIYEALQGKVDGIVTIVLSGSLGAAYSSACNAREMVSTVPVEVIDSRTCMPAQGFMVLRAAEAASAGKSMKEIVQIVRNLIPKTHIFWAMETLEYMGRGGRVSLPQTVLANWLNIKPIVGIEEGKVAPLARVRSKPKAVQKLLELMAERVTGTGPLHVGVIHGDAPKEAEQLADKIRDRYEVTEMTFSEITPVVGTHIGPDTLGIALYSD